MSSTEVFDQLNSNDILCKKLLHELLKNQSVASWAASTLESGEVRFAKNPRRGVPIIGRNGQDCKLDHAPVEPTTPHLDQASIATLLRSLVTEQPQSDSSSDTSSEISMASSNIMKQRSFSVPGDHPPVKTMNPDRFKTELCRQFQETGFCKYGAKCQFAHGHHELRSVSRHLKYKTEMCRTYHTTGLCPYGTRCHFIHDEEEMVTKPRPVTQHKSLSRHASHPITATNRFNPTVGSYLDLTASMGSVGDTPPSSISSSPAPSPIPACFTYEEEEDEGRTKSLPITLAPPPGFSVPPHKPSTPRVFTFPDAPGITEPSPLDINIPAFNPVNSLAAGLQSIDPRYGKDLMSDCFKDFYYSPASPQVCNPDSDSESSPIESPMDISRNLRLPIFSQLSKEAV